MAIYEAGLDIQSAHIGSYGERIFDAFYVQTFSGKKFTDAAGIAGLESTLLDILSREEPDTPSTRHPQPPKPQTLNPKP